jgi:hypothetical protein
MNKNSILLIFSFVFIGALMLVASPVVAQMSQSVLGSVRCGTKLIQIGRDTKESVLAKCGEPTERNSGTSGGGEAWFYNRGSTRFSGLLRFTGDKLTAIQKTGYGFAEPSSQQ